MAKAYAVKFEDGTYLKTEWNESLNCEDVWSVGDITRANFFDFKAAKQVFDEITGEKESDEDYNYYYCKSKPSKIVEIEIIEAGQN